VFSRPGFETAAETSEAGKELALFRLDESEGGRLAEADPPAWAFYSATANPMSSTELRKSR
ncbi:MAG: nicotinic acid mononucleotide adenylyltransferase, partial [Amphiplicatus sp.]